ncbi:MAG: HEAT repeat domain-containing protein [Asgard group archaeon]|nr:HEAT repeat domain-containing protein [Asgard group archaeon]
MNNDNPNISSEISIKTIKQQLKSNNIDYKIMALHQLRTNTFPETNSILKELIKRDSNNSIREIALYILHERNDPDIVTFLRRIYFNTTDNRFIRARAIWSLSQNNEPEAIEIVRTAIEDSSEEVAYWAILGLLNQEKNETALAILRRILLKTRSILVRQAIMLYFGIIKDESSRIDIERSLLDDSHPSIRLQSAWALRYINSIKSINSLCTALQKEMNSLAKREMALSIGYIIQKQDLESKHTKEYFSVKDVAINCLTRIFSRDTAYIVRRACAESLGRIGDKKAVPDLLDKITIDTNQFVRRDIIIALGKIGDTQALEALSNAKKSNYRIIVQAAHEAILQIKNNQ